MTIWLTIVKLLRNVLEREMSMLTLGIFYRICCLSWCDNKTSFLQTGPVYCLLTLDIFYQICCLSWCNNKTGFLQTGPVYSDKQDQFAKKELRSHLTAFRSSLCPPYLNWFDTTNKTCPLEHFTYIAHISKSFSIFSMMHCNTLSKK